MIRSRSLLQITSIIRKNNFCCYNTINSNKNFVNISTDERTNLITLTLNKPPVNSLNLDFLKELCATFNSLEEIKPKGVIITSFSDKVFTAGLDFAELYKPEKKRLRIFWKTLQDLMIKLYELPYPTVAVVNGHAPAGGCLLALCCDYRVMVNNFTIGLNEVSVGIAVPPWLALAMRNTINKRQTELALTVGKLFITKEAFEIGLIDEIASDKADAVNKALKFFNQYKSIDFDAHITTKNYVRRCDVEFIKSIREEDVENNVTLIMQPTVQSNIEVYINKIKKG